MNRRLRLAAAAAILALTGACFTPRKTAAPPQVPSSTEIYVAVGGSETTGVGSDVPLRDAYPQVFFRKALPAGTVFINVAVSDALASSALAHEVPEATALNPTIVTVLLGADDLLSGTDPTTFETDLGRIVHDLRHDGRTTVLVGNVARLDAVPTALLELYNGSIARICADEGARLVDLRAVEVSPLGGRYPDTAGHASIADALAKALGIAQA